ncbi:MAG: lysophospholipid acyltransferase family protein [Deltaproteobacteria bacterium]|nr:lysophospholipid acyltransferase family protein [Deltaproteobacteria bacterium]
MKSAMPFSVKPFKPLLDVIVTLLMWIYFTWGFFLFFAPRYVAAVLRRADREAAFQRLNCIFFRGFFRLLRLITPGVTLNIRDEIRTIRSSVIVCNHLSYLDPILLISLFEKQKTIVKSAFFNVPVFSSILRQSGYIPSAGDDYASLMIRNIENIREYLASGGNVFIFPEGTRSRTGRLGPFNKGAFSIARYCRAPIQCLMIRDTNRLFVPGRFRFNTCMPVSIGVERIGVFDPDYGDPAFRLAALISQIRSLYEKRLAKG